MLVRFLAALPVGAVVGGWLVRRLPAGVITAVGMVLRGGRRSCDGALGADDPQDSSSNVPLVLGGLGFGLALAPVNAAVLATTDDDIHGVASALRRGRPDGRHAGRHLGADHLGLRRSTPSRPTSATSGRCATAPAGVPSSPGCSGRRHRPGAGRLPGRRCLRRRRRRARPRAVPLGAPTRGRRRGRAAARRPAEPSANLSPWTTSTTCSPPTGPSPRLRLGGFDGVAQAGVALVTCMDSRIDPLRMLGLGPATPRSSATPAAGSPPQALEALVLGVHLLGVKRVLVVPHTRCAVAAHTEAELRARRRVRRAWTPPGSRSTSSTTSTPPSPRTSRKVRAHPLIPDSVAGRRLPLRRRHRLLDQKV